MAQTQTATYRSSQLQQSIDNFFTGLGQGFNAYVAKRTRMAEMDRLNAMTDKELAVLGITRDRIPHYVFSDLFHQ